MLPALQRREECACLAHQLITSTAPTYLSADIQLVSEHGRRHLRSSSYRTLAVPRTRTTLGDRSFTEVLLGAVAGVSSYYMYVCTGYRQSCKPDAAAGTGPDLRGSKLGSYPGASTTKGPPQKQ